MRIEIKRGNDQVLRLPKLRTSAVPVEYLNAATVTATLYDSRGTAVHGFQSMPLAYVAESEGTYQKAIDGPTTLVLTPSTLYTLEVKARQNGMDFRVVYEVTVKD